jgi:HK97 gp10 family phage protein
MPRRVLTKKGKAVRWEGIPELQSKVDAILAKTGYRQGQKIGNEIKRVLMGGALVLRDEARDLVPVKTGTLKSAIFAAYGDERKSDVLVGVNYKIAPHAHLVEYGTSHSAAHPFMRPAITATRAKIANVVAEGFRKIIQDFD